MRRRALTEAFECLDNAGARMTAGGESNTHRSQMRVAKTGIAVKVEAFRNPQ